MRPSAEYNLSTSWPVYQLPEVLQARVLHFLLCSGKASGVSEYETNEEKPEEPVTPNLTPSCVLSAGYRTEKTGKKKTADHSAEVISPSTVKEQSSHYFQPESTPSSSSSASSFLCSFSSPARFSSISFLPSFLSFFFSYATQLCSRRCVASPILATTTHADRQQCRITVNHDLPEFLHRLSSSPSLGELEAGGNSPAGLHDSHSCVRSPSSPCFAKAKVCFGRALLADSKRFNNVHAPSVSISSSSAASLMARAADRNCGIPHSVKTRSGALYFISTGLANRVFIVEQAVSQLLVVNRAKEEAEWLRHKGLMKAGSVGVKRQICPLYRGDELLWLHEEQLKEWNCEGLVALLSVLQGLCEKLIHSYLPEAAATFSTQFQLAHYAEGSFGYAPHFDSPPNRTTDNTCSLDSRLLTMVLYLNPIWAAEDGGELCIFSAFDGNTDEDVAQIWPVANRLVVFRSDLVKHGVLKCNRSRWAVTCWLYVNRFSRQE